MRSFSWQFSPALVNPLQLYNPRMLFEVVTIVGVGLIGGSVGMAVRKRQIARQVNGIDRDPRILTQAIELGAIDSGTTELGTGTARSSLVVFCTPVDRIAAGILELAALGRSGVLITDVGSTKGNIIAAVSGQLPATIEYVPAHPLTGSEKTGARFGHADLFENRVTVVTPIPGGSRSAVHRVRAFWEALGSQVIELQPADHDLALAVTSHLPHAVASALAGVTPIDWLTLTAGGFRDVTRIAAANPELWAGIFLANRDDVLSAVSTFTKRLSQFHQLLDARDEAGLVQWLTEGKQVRDALGN
jgi:prephenate dehydrogenase